ncbi:MAG: thioredoxin domain-containing protein [Vicingaceae bacterium]
MSEQHTNALIHESSPYLLQHAHNPVDWHPWGEVALKKAKKENKPLLISIGYSACHWCHVMEKESFEDSAVAAIMNENFICIKVDREERPDVDQVYMNAVQLMTGKGGWPLNCIATPDGRPFYGGTYFPKEQWMEVLKKLTEVYKNEPSKVEEYANKLTRGIQASDLIEKKQATNNFSLDSLTKGLNKWKQMVDTAEGGMNQAPKFPMPNNYQFLLNCNFIQPDSELKAHLDLSLKKMAFGGIYDHLGGGFARYSTDTEWKVPHFEKMLYDNAQLISLYSEAYRQNPKPLYKNVVYESIEFVERELRDGSGAFYSALDADTEGEEGKFYVWKKEELREILRSDFDLFARHFNVNEKGFWENGNYILLRNEEDDVLAQKAEMSLADYRNKIEKLKEKLFQLREKRTKPGLDDKSLTSWNALQLKGLCDAYLSFHDKHHLALAEENAAFIVQKQTKEDNSLHHSFKNGRSSIEGYLEDYAFCMEAFIALYQCTFKEEYLKQAEAWADFCIEHFFDEKSGMFFFTADNSEALIARKLEVNDNVIPASNSALAKSLHQLGLLLEKKEYVNLSQQMLSNMQEQLSGYLPAASNWGILQLRMAKPYYEVAICGPQALNEQMKLQAHYFPNHISLGSENKNSSLPLLEGKLDVAKTTFYVCENKVCQLPVKQVEKAIIQLKTN